MTNHTRYYTLKKQFYKEHPRVEKRTWEEIDRFLNLHQIKFSGFDFPKPVWSLDEINFPDYIASELRLQGITRPSAIQSMSWPSIYSGRDIMCIGLPTASRVLSYICPAIVFVREQPIEVRKTGPLVLIVTQTKEVAKEIFTHAQMFIHQSRCSYCCLYDDENINSQSVLLKEHEPDILIANYHRLCELMDNELVNLKNVSFLVMDDFYRNRSARLSDEIKRVVNETRSDRQTVIFSRIVPSGLQKSNGDEFQSDAVFVSVGNDDVHVHNRDMPQAIHVCTMAEKRKKLQDIITEIAQQEKNFKILVYANGFKKIRITEKIIKELKIDTFAYERTPAGRRRRAMKEKVYYNFNATPNSILVASDVISPKVELPELNYIINADFPVTLSLYLNRMRMPNIRKYISIFIAEDARHAERLIYVLNECRQPAPCILYKISEAYVNSGKDVDRMPSLQEINDGMTKPVEKPIPKPLPPTVSSDVSTTMLATKSTSTLTVTTCAQQPENDDATPISYQTSSTVAAIAAVAAPAPVEQSNPQLSPALSSSSSTSSTGSSSAQTQSTLTESSADMSSASSVSISSTSSLAASMNKRTSPSTVLSASSSSPSLYTNGRLQHPYDYGGPIKRTKTYHRPPGLTPSPNPYYNNRPRYSPMHTYPPNPMYTAAITSPTYYAPASNYMYPPPPLPQPSNGHNGTSYYATSPPVPPQQQQQQQQQPPPQTQQYYIPVTPVQQHPQAPLRLPNCQLLPSASITIKSEPQEASTSATTATSSTYFTNPIPFKQEPIDTAAATAPQRATTSTKIDEDAAALSLVNHLLKDQQILNRLEQVAQSFRLN